MMKRILDFGVVILTVEAILLIGVLLGTLIVRIISGAI